jgi:quercetin dioxygenase-like cupin family protein
VTEPFVGTVDWSEVPETPAVPGITARACVGAQLSAAMFVLQPGARVPLHAHASEEFGFVVRGAIEVSWGETRAVIGAGESFIIPGDVDHHAVALEEGCELLECYAPPRDPAPRN